MLLLSVCKVYSIVHLAAGGVDAGDKHHVVIVAFHDPVVYLLDIIDRCYAHVVYVHDDESVFDSGRLEFAILKS